MDTTMIDTTTIRKVSTPEKPTQKNLPKSALSTIKKMQNEPNLNNWKFSLSAPSKMNYPAPDTWYRGKNEPNTNPNEPIFSKPNKLVLRGDGCYDDYLNLRHIRRF